MATVTTLASFTAPVGTRIANFTDLVIAPNGDLLTLGTAVNASTGAPTTTAYDLVHTPAGYAAAPVALPSFSSVPGSAASNIVTDAAGDLFGVVAPPTGSSYVFELPRVAGAYAAPVTLATLTGSQRATLTIDAAGDLFGASTSLVGSNYQQRIFEIAKSAAGYAPEATLLSYPSGTSSGFEELSHDAAGNLFFVARTSMGESLLELPIAPGGGYAAAPVTLFTADPAALGYGALGAISLDAAGDVFVQDAASRDVSLLYLPKTGLGATGYAATPTIIDSEPANYGNISVGDLAVIDANGDLFLVEERGGTPADNLSFGPGLILNVAKTNGGYPATPLATNGPGPSVIYTFPEGGTASVGSNPVPTLVADGNGVLYGVTRSGGANFVGVIYAVTGSGYNAAGTPAPTPPAITGVTSPESDPGGATLRPFAAATVTDANASPTITVQLQSVAVVNGQPGNLGTGGAFAGGGFTVAGGQATFTSTSLAAVQAAVQAVSFTPAAADARIIYTISDSAGGVNTASVDVLTTPNTPPTVTGVPATEADPGGVAYRPFTTAVLTDPDVGQSFTVQLSAAPVGGGPALEFGGGAFTGPGVKQGAGRLGLDVTLSATSIADLQAELRQVLFTPSAPPPTSTGALLSVQLSDGVAISSTVVAVDYVGGGTPNTAPAIGGAQTGQADTAGVAISPFSQVTVTDPDAGQGEAVTVSFAAANGVLSGGGFTLTGTVGGVSTYSVTAPAGGAGASAAAAQADLRAAVFTPTAGQSATTTFTVTVSDGQAPAATDSTTTVVATYTPPVTPPATGGGGAVTTTPPSVQYGLQTQFQNLERALAGGSDAVTPGTPVYAAFQAEKAVAAQLDGGQVTLAQAEATLQHLVDGTTAVAVASYGFFTGYTPTAAGLTYLVHSGANATDLNDAYYARFSTENRYINFAVNLATGPGAGAAAFQASYGGLSLADATAKAYAAVFGASADAAKVSALLNTLVPDGLGGQETRGAYFAQYGGDGPNGQGTKAAMIGFLLSNAVHDGSGVYGAATEHYLAAVAHGAAPAFGSELALAYGPAVNLVGTTPVPDPTITG